MLHCKNNCQSLFCIRRIFSREQRKKQLDWLATNTDDITTQSHSLCSREKNRQVESGLNQCCKHTSNACFSSAIASGSKPVVVTFGTTFAGFLSFFPSPFLPGDAGTIDVLLAVAGYQGCIRPVARMLLTWQSRLLSLEIHDVQLETNHIDKIRNSKSSHLDLPLPETG